MRRSSSSRNISTPSPSPSRPVSTSQISAPPQQESPSDTEVRKFRELVEDRAAAQRELNRYEAAGVISSLKDTGMVNMIHFWSVSC